MPTTAELSAKWLQLDKDESTRAEIQHLIDKDDQQALDARLGKRIAFGTAGLRSSMKAGFAHMNSLTVLQASHGLAKYITSQAAHSELSVVIGYDARYNSEKFARLTAAAFLSHGFTVFWFGALVHTPIVPFTVMLRKASAGVMVTASHNPKNDNGYKVYWSNGSQIIPPHDAGIAAEIAQVETVDTWDLELVNRHPNVENVFKTASEEYFKAVGRLVGNHTDSELSFTYTPMHGVGLPFVQGVAKDMGLTSSLRLVQEQAYPDPEFPTVPFPNPEEKGALDLAIRVAEGDGTTLILANDPDADRFAVAEKMNGSWHQFSGNEMGVLLASHVLETYQGDKSKLAMLASTVSSRMLSIMAKREGFRFQETLTGFKWLGNVAQNLHRQGLDPAFAYEEAIGYMFPTVVWDKDGVAALAVFLAACQRWKKLGLTPMQKLEQLYATYGYFADGNTYLISPSPETTARVFSAIRAGPSGAPPRQVGRRPIRRWRDLTTGFDTASSDSKPDLPVDPTAQMITCELEDVVFTARGSGTEPKIKLYIEANASSHAQAQVVANEVLADLLREWFKPEYGLKLAGS